MNSSDALRAMVDRSGLSMRAASVASGRSPEFISGTVSRGSSPTLATAAELAAACGYALAFVPTGDVPHGALVIDPTPARRPGAPDA